jgi:hypothetical protein
MLRIFKKTQGFIKSPKTYKNLLETSQCELEKKPSHHLLQKVKG